MRKIEKSKSLIAPWPGDKWTTYGYAFVDGKRVATIESPLSGSHVDGMKYRVMPDCTLGGKRHWAKTFRTLSEAKAYCEEIAA